VDLSFALNRAISGFNPADFHLTNLAIHVTATLLLYGFVRRSLLLAPSVGRPAPAAWLAFLVAALWTVHPLQTESVTYVVQRAESLMGAMGLGVCYAFVRSLDAPRPGRWRALAWMLCLLGMGTKEMMVMVPFLLVLFDATFVTDSWIETLRKRAWFHTAMIATLAGFAALLATGMARAADEGGLFYGESLRWRYLLTQSQALLHYLRLTILPWPLCLDYRWPLVAGWRDVIWQAPLVGAFVAAAAYGAIRHRRWAFPAMWILAILAPTSSVLPLPDVVFEHRMYLPLAGVLAMAVVGGYVLIGSLPLAGRRWAQRAAVGVALLVTLAFAGLTWQRNTDYRTEEAMWREVIHARPGSLRAYVSLSTALLAEHRPGDALVVARALLDRVPDYQGVPFAELERRWKARPETPVIEYAMAHNNVGAAYLALDRNAEAEPHFREAARVVPRAYWAHSNLAKALYFQGRRAEAVASWRTAVALQPKDQQTQTYLAVALAAGGQDREAIEHFRAALELNPDDAFVRAQLAWTLATHADAALRDGAEAVRVAEPLLAQAEGRSARAFDVVAAAYAEAGRLPEAVHAEEQALQLILRPTPGAAPSSVLPAEVRERLALYGQGQPYRQRAVAPADTNGASPVKVQDEHVRARP